MFLGLFIAWIGLFYVLDHIYTRERTAGRYISADSNKNYRQAPNRFRNVRRGERTNFYVCVTDIKTNAVCSQSPGIGIYYYSWTLKGKAKVIFITNETSLAHK